MGQACLLLPLAWVSWNSPTLVVAASKPSKDKLIRKHLKIFSRFTNEISFDKLNGV